MIEVLKNNFGRRDLVVSLVMSLGISVISYTGDKILTRSRNPIVRAITDNLTHALVGGLTWSIILKLSQKSLLKNLWSIFLCFSISSLIDLDHFLLARSWKLHDAINLQGQRPALHCSSLPIITWLLLITVAKIFQRPVIAYYAWLILASFASHHVRDATRRGFWLPPLGSTPPLPYHMYLSVATILPWIVHALLPTDLIGTNLITPLVHFV